MPEWARNKDVVVLFKGDCYTVSVDQAMVDGQWAGGQGVKWTQATTDNFLVTYSDGLYGGFILEGSNEDVDQFISYVDQQLIYRYGVLCAGGWLIMTRTFELYTWASRQVGPLVPNVYTVGSRLRFSLRGLFTSEDEWTLSGDPRAPNTYFIGTVVQAPILNPRGIPYLTVQTSI